ncbi:hypothetical protein C7974DRAFT_471421 [Boeremia exigua]|uniref:uncharacterized protein n=1 Tax=Boeremia exigua TaxID=749465 RepID=UPI001E8E2D9B|nr:uncharacterized protein C7974DRAFT_471421 [Boeremia exigua]KAH6633226.1 hypothetical protein C7974DRAFT_471421 [Boeremia exigua]
MLTLGSPINIPKRKWQGGNISLPLQGLIRPDSAGAPWAQTAPAKKQKTERETTSQHIYAPPPATLHQSQSFPHNTLIVDPRSLQLQNQYLPHNPSAIDPRSLQLQNQYLPHNPSMVNPRPPQVQNQNQNQYPSQNPSSLQPRPPRLQNVASLNPMTVLQGTFIAALNSKPDLLPSNPTQDPVRSSRIDRIAHIMWQLVFKQDELMKDITAKASMFAQIKLRALAKLNYLPSWWLLREAACDFMKRQRWVVNDSNMQTLWKDTLEWCKRVETKLGMQNDGATATKEETSETSPAQEQHVKVET